MKKIIASMAFALGALLCAAPASADIVVTFTPAAKHIAIGEEVTVDVSIAGLGDEILSAFDINFVYDTPVLNWRYVTIGPVVARLGTDPIYGFDDLSEGHVGANGSATDDDAALAAVQPNDFLMFQIRLEGMADGATILTLGPDLDFERNFVGREFQSLLASIGSACITVGAATECGNAVPEPSTLALLGLALGGGTLIGLRRRRFG